jgi:Flp pilus assembly protein TadD
MARAAAKRRPPARPPDKGRKHKDSSGGGQRYEDQLFFNRLRTHAKWVFVLLIIAFTFGFVLFGVGSSNLGGLGDIFNGIRGGGGNPSVDKPLKATQKNPKDAKAWNDLAGAYDLAGDYQLAIPAWLTYTKLRPKDPDGLTRLATDYEQQFAAQSTDAQNAQVDAQNAQTVNFGPPTTSPLGRALASLADPIGSAVSSSASTRFSAAMTSRQQTATELVTVYQQLAKLQPSESGTQLQLAGAAETAGNYAVAIAAYQRFLKIAPDDPNAPQAKARIKALQKQLSGSPSSPQG